MTSRAASCSHHRSLRGNCMHRNDFMKVGTTTHTYLIAMPVGQQAFTFNQICGRHCREAHTPQPPRRRSPAGVRAPPRQLATPQASGAFRTPGARPPRKPAGARSVHYVSATSSMH